MSSLLEVAGLLPLGSLRILKAVVITLALWEMAARIGLGAASLLRHRPHDDLERFGFGVLLGWPVLGVSYLGLAMAGLFYPSLVLLLAGALLVAGGRPGAARSLIYHAGRSLAPAGGLGLLAAGLGLSLLIVMIMVPELDVDCYIYHLGVPWQSLQAHMILIDLVPRQHHLPLPIEMTYALPMSLGLPHLAKWVNLSFFLGVSAVFASDCFRRGLRAPAWLGPLLVLPMFEICWLLPLSKNDVAAAALIVGGALAQRRREWLLCAVLFGSGIAAKLVVGPFVLFWWILNPPPLRGLPVLLSCLVVPVLPWFGKSLCATGNPVYPLASGIIPSFGWDPRNADAWAKCARPLMAPDTFELARIPLAWWGYVRNSHLLLAAILPGLAVLGRDRRAIWACIAAGMAILFFGHVPRYMTVALWLPCLVAAAETARLPGRWAARAPAILGSAALLLLFVNPRIRPLPVKSALMAADEVLQEGLTTYLEAIGMTRSRTGRRLLTVAVPRVFPLSGRVIYGGVHGETPLVWDIVRRSNTADEVAKRFRQLGSAYLLHNFVRIEWVAMRYDSFPWTDRMVRLYLDYCKRHMTVADPPRQVDVYLNGAFYLFRLHRRPLPVPQKWVFFAPGTEILHRNGIGLRGSGQYEQALEACLAAKRALPDVGHSWNELGLTYTYLARWEEAYRELQPFVDRGMIDDANLISLGYAALALGKLEESERVFRRALDVAPKAIDTIQVNRGIIRYSQALQHLRAGRKREAESLLREGKEMMNSVSCRWSQALTDQRRHYVAMSDAVLAELAAARGDASEAAALYREALQLAPDSPSAPAWRARVQKP